MKLHTIHVTHRQQMQQALKRWKQRLLYFPYNTYRVKVLNKSWQVTTNSIPSSLCVFSSSDAKKNKPRLLRDRLLLNPISNHACIIKRTMTIKNFWAFYQAVFTERRNKVQPNQLFCITIITAHMRLLLYNDFKATLADIVGACMKNTKVDK